MWSQLLCVVATAAMVWGHGRVLDPPGRGGLFRVGYSVTADYDDDGLNCGGFNTQYSVNDGKCGVCGDAYNAATPRAHEYGGTYDTGIITASYEAGSIVTITVQISAYHQGYWEFKICTDRYSTEQECFDEHPVELAAGGTKYYPSGSGTYNVEYKIPEGLNCEHCVLQWRYTAGNNWGYCGDGTGALGCGDQENFGACSDIAITGGTTEYIDANSLLLERLNNLGMLHLLFTSPSAQAYWTPAPNQSQVTTKNITNKRRKHKGKKKVKPYKSKWNTYWS